MDQIVRAVEPDYETTRAMLDALKRRFPHARLGVCGRSLSGRSIYTLSIGPQENPVLYAGGFHGQEWLTPLLLLRFFERTATAVWEGDNFSAIPIQDALHGRGMMIVPCVNPDGVQIALHGAQGAGRYEALATQISGGDFSRWNANARGVDINHNFNAGWETLHQMEQESGITGPAPRQYGGTAPESEPETQALVRLCRAHSFRHALAFHSQGEEIFWEYGEHTPERGRMMAKIFAASSGYQLVENDGLASHGGFKDWFISEFNRPGFTFEIGRGENPLPLSGFEQIYEKLEETLLLAALM